MANPSRRRKETNCLEWRAVWLTRMGDRENEKSRVGAVDTMASGFGVD